MWRVRVFVFYWTRRAKNHGTGSLLKPDFIFFGESVPTRRVERVTSLVHNADALLVLGTSAHVWSSFRFLKLAAELSKPMAIVNAGECRADSLPNVALRLHSLCGETLTAAIQS